MPMSDAKLRALKARSSPYKISDGEGLYILVKPNGSRLWQLAYRFNGKQKTLAFGKYPHISLLHARRARDDAKRKLAEGSDPSAHRKEEKRMRTLEAGSTFETVENEWFDNNKCGWVKADNLLIRMLPPRGRSHGTLKAASDYGTVGRNTPWREFKAAQCWQLLSKTNGQFGCSW